MEESERGLETYIRTHAHTQLHLYTHIRIYIQIYSCNASLSDSQRRAAGRDAGMQVGGEKEAGRMRRELTEPGTGRSEIDREKDPGAREETSLPRSRALARAFSRCILFLRASDDSRLFTGTPRPSCYTLT